jgi:inner membrane transporter RhtA
MVVLSIVATEVGAALAKGLFDELGSAGAVALRAAVAAVSLLALWRPRLVDYRTSDLLFSAALGLALAAMNLSFYAAMERIPLGITVALEFVGPLGLAVVTSRRALDLVWVVLAGGGVALLTRSEGQLDPWGIVLALLAGLFWAAYIVLSAQTGRRVPGGVGLTIAMTVSAFVLLPGGIASAGVALLEPGNLALGIVVGLVSSTLPYSLQFEALRKLPAGVVSILLSIEPAVATVVGLVMLGELLGLREIAGISLIVAASVGTTRSARAD